LSSVRDGPGIDSLFDPHFESFRIMQRAILKLYADDPI
jgi:hypothetical protein